MHPTTYYPCQFCSHMFALLARFQDAALSAASSLETKQVVPEVAAAGTASCAAPVTAQIVVGSAPEQPECAAPLSSIAHENNVEDREDAQMLPEDEHPYFYGKAEEWLEKEDWKIQNQKIESRKNRARRVADKIYQVKRYMKRRKAFLGDVAAIREAASYRQLDDEELQVLLEDED